MAEEMTGEELWRRRRALGMSRPEMAAYLGVSIRTMSAWETGTRGIAHQDFLVRVAINAAEQAALRGLPLPDWRQLASETTWAAAVSLVAGPVAVAD